MNDCATSSTSTMTKLPPEFADLEGFSDWCLPTEAERYAQAAGQHDGRDAGLLRRHHPRAEEAIAYCDKFSLDEMPEDVLNLMHLLYSMIMVSFPVECWKQPRCPTPAPPRSTVCPNRSRDGAASSGGPDRSARCALGRCRGGPGAFARGRRGRGGAHPGGQSR